MATLFVTYTGITDYPVKPLNGCIIDVLRMDSLFAQLSENKINYKPAYFLSPKPAELPLFESGIFPRAKRIRSLAQPATFENITTRAFKHFSAARAGDVCIFYYSGHGSQMVAPVEFAHLDPGGKCQTLVLADSRTPGRRDLIDKELAWLCWSAMHEHPGVSFYAILDCCHAGSMMRSAADSLQKTAKALPPSSEIPYSSWLGYDAGYYKIKDNNAAFELLPHVQLSACLAAETSADMPGGSVFTSALLKLAAAVAGSMSWHDLAQLTGALMQATGNEQHAASYATDERLLKIKFPGFGTQNAAEAPFTLSYDGLKKNWIINAGAVHGLQIKKNAEKPVFLLPTVKKLITVKKILADGSVTDAPVNLKTNTIYPAGLLAPGGSLLHISLGKEAPAAALIKSYSELPWPAFDFVQATADLKLQHVPAEGYLLSRQGATEPLLREKDPDKLLSKLQHISRWLRSHDLRQTSSIFSAADITATLHYGLFAADKKAEKNKMKLKPFQTVKITASEEKQLLFQLEIALASGSPLQECYVSALYFTHDFRISSSLVARDNNLLSAGNSIFIPGREKLLEIKKHSPYPDLVKIILSDFPVDFTVFELQGIQPDAERAKKKDSSREWCTVDFELSYE